MSVQDLLLACNKALDSDEEDIKAKFIEEWIPVAVNEIESLSGRVIMLELQIADLESRLEE